MKKLVVLMLCIIIVVISSGCWDQKIYENTGFILQVGFETDGEDKVKISYLLPVVEPNADDISEIVYSDSNLLREFREKSRKLSNQLIEGGKIQQLVISDNLANKGINNLLEVIEREPSNPPNCFIVIAEGSVIQMAETARQFTDKPKRPAIYIKQLIENNAALSYIPESRVFEFTTKYFSPGIDPVAPIIKLRLNGGKGIEVRGTALFAGDKMVGKIDTEKTPFLLAMMGRMKRTQFIARSVSQEHSENEKKYAAIAINNFKRKLSVKIINNKPVVDINLNFNGSISEYQWNKKYDEQLQNSIQNKIAAEIEQNCYYILNYTKEVGSDPIGIGDIVRAKYNSYWENVKWENAYKATIFNVKVKLNITNHGVIQ